MKEINFIILFFLLSVAVLAQSAESSFHLASSQFIHGKMADAKATVTDALHRYPNDPKLNSLNKQIKEDEKKEDQKKKQEEQDKKDQEKKDQEQKEQQQKNNKDQQDKKDKDKEGKDKKGKEKEDQEKKSEGQKEQEKKAQEKKEQEKSGDPSKDEKKNENQKTPPQVAEKLKEMNISEEKARMILEAMKTQEVQYLQQNKHKATKPKDKGKPDW